MFLTQIRKNKKEGPSSSTRESENLPMLSETNDFVKSKAERGLCSGKPRKYEVLLPMGQHLTGLHRVHNRGAHCCCTRTAKPWCFPHCMQPSAMQLPMPLHLHGSGFFSQRQRVILRLLPLMLLVHNDQKRPAFRGKRAGAS